MAKIIDTDICLDCGTCIDECLKEAIRDGEICPVIIFGLCDNCGACSDVCPVDAIG